MEFPASVPPEPSASGDEPTQPDGERVLIYAPVGRDAGLIHEALLRDGIASVICLDGATFRTELDRGAGALLLTQEALAGGLSVLTEILGEQPSWSDLPLITLVSPVSTHADRRQVNRLLEMHATVLERPIRLPTLISVIRSALRARRRQHEVRRLVGALNQSNATLEDRVLERTAEVRALASSLTLAEQRERNRLSDLLHDHIQQLLFAVQLKFKLLATSDAKDEAEILAQAEALLGEAMHAIRTLTVELHPPVLSEDGLTVALDWMATHMREQYDLEVEVDTLGPCLLQSKELLILLTQSVKELLFNVVKHAETDHARIEVRPHAQGLRVTVQDEGRGFDPRRLETADSRGHGLYALGERLRLLGGALTIESAPGQGTMLVLDVPLSTQPASESLPVHVG